MGFRVQGLGFRDQGLEFWVWGGLGLPVVCFGQCMSRGFVVLGRRDAIWEAVGIELCVGGFGCFVVRIRPDHRAKPKSHNHNPSMDTTIMIRFPEAFLESHGGLSVGLYVH